MLKHARDACSMFIQPVFFSGVTVCAIKCSRQSGTEVSRESLV